MTAFQFDSVLQGRKWISPGVITVDDDGKIVRVSSESNSVDEKISGWAIPGFQNAHSHAFQYAMAGLAEHLPKAAKSDDFWSWRELMYDIALSVSPDEMQSIATMAYAEMLRGGITSVAEFHYLHHDPKGTPYSNPTEMGDRLRAAASDAGIQLTLIPIFYRWSDFKKPASMKQRRFILSSVDAYFDLLERYKKNQGSLGLGIHSLRASSPEETVAILEHKSKLPKHLHIAEQEKEVASCKMALKARPIDWLFRNFDIDERFHLVHCTHASSSEIKKIAKAKAHVVLCPSTEGNLGDGFFGFEELTQLGGQWSIGTDSHIGLSSMEELRWLDYGTRLRLGRRNVTCRTPGTDSGQLLYEQAFRGGKRAMGSPFTKMFEAGDAFDAVVLNSSAPLLSAVKSERRLSTLIFSGDASMLMGTITDGKWRVKDGRHLQHEKIAAKFSTAIQSIRR